MTAKQKREDFNMIQRGSFAILARPHGGGKPAARFY
jgi:hypothetical protein